MEESNNYINVSQVWGIVREENISEDIHLPVCSSATESENV